MYRVRRWYSVHCKIYPHIHGYFAASFPYLNGSTSSVYVCIRKSTEIHGIMKPWHIALMSACASLFVDLAYGYKCMQNPFPLKYDKKLVTKYPWI